jgi:Uma2 family endonuclease
MGSAAHDIEPIDNIHDFWRWLQHQEGRYELVDGRIVAMAGASSRHDRIQINLIAGLRPQLRGGPCRVTGPELMVRTRPDDRRGRFPDLAVNCGREEPTFIAAPTVVFEILSPDSALRDRGEKLHEYRAMPSVMHYVLVEQALMRVEVYSRDAQGWRYDELAAPEAELRLDPPGGAMPLAEIYDGVELGPPPEPGGVEIP